MLPLTFGKTFKIRELWQRKENISVRNEHTIAMRIDISLIGAVKNALLKTNVSAIMLCVRGLTEN